MKAWRPIDFIISILTITICVILVLTIVDMMINMKTLTEAGSKMVTAIITSILSILSMYAGAMIQRNIDK